MLLVLGLALACGGGDVAPPEPLRPDMLPPDVPPPSVVVASDPTGQVVLDPPLIAEIVRVRGEFDAAQTTAAVAQAWRDANALAERLAGALRPAFEKSEYQLDVSWLVPSLPGITAGAEAEGTALVFSLASDAWLAKAANTPEPDDDRFFALLAAVYGTASIHGYAAWESRTWDYGGCNTFGDGAVVEALKLSDAAASDAFRSEVAAVRAEIWDGALKDNPLFVYCDPSTAGPTADERLRAEAQRILAEVKLSPPEKSALEARIPNLKGAAFQGG
jgi:hypothetical protein